jgi:SAM-dependent methyltransferase
MLSRDADYFQELQTHTGWGRTLYGFAVWCSPMAGSLTLDVGCGPGLLPAIFLKLGCRAVGVDLNIEMFRPKPLHPIVAVADVYTVPFGPRTFDLITASNLIFLLPDSIKALSNLKQLLRSGGKFAMLNPSEQLNPQAAIAFADEIKMEGIARDTLLNWAKRAAEHHQWTDDETRSLYEDVGMKFQGSVLKVGPGFGRFSSGTA